MSGKAENTVILVFEEELIECARTLQPVVDLMHVEQTPEAKEQLSNRIMAFLNQAYKTLYHLMPANRGTGKYYVAMGRMIVDPGEVEEAGRVTQGD